VERPTDSAHRNLGVDKCALCRPLGLSVPVRARHVVWDADGPADGGHATLSGNRVGHRGEQRVGGRSVDGGGDADFRATSWDGLGTMS